MDERQFRQGLKQEVVQKAREILARREEGREVGEMAHTIWKSLLDAPEWSVASPPRPKDKRNADEIWRQPVEYIGFDKKAEQ